MQTPLYLTSREVASVAAVEDERMIGPVVLVVLLCWKVQEVVPVA